MISDILTRLLFVNLALAGAIVVILALRPLVRRRFGAQLAYRLWLAAPLAALGVLIPRPHGLFGQSAPLRIAADQAVTLIFGPTTGAAAKPVHAALDAPLLMLALWLAGVAVALVLTLLAHARGMKSFGSLTRAPGGVLRATRHGLGPAMVGLLRPRLVLPADFEARFEAREQALILAHEHHHLACGDVRTNGVVSLIGCLNWFNPLVHLAAFQLRVDQELACDAAVVERFPGERRTYAQALLKSQLACAPLPLGCNWPGRSPNLLQERLTMLAFKTPQRRHLLAGSILVGALCTGLAAAAWAVGPGETPSKVGFACMGSSCAQQSVQNPVPRDAEKVAAGIKAADGRAVYEAGGNASDVLAAWTAYLEARGDGKAYGDRNLRDVVKPGSQVFVSKGGIMGVSYELIGGGHQTMYLGGLTPPPGAPDDDERDRQLYGAK